MLPISPFFRAVTMSQDPFFVPPQRRHRPSPYLRFAVISCWLVTALTLMVSIWFWRKQVWPIDFRWSVVLLGVMLLWGGVVLVLGTKRLILGPDRFGALVGVFLGLTPWILWPAMIIEDGWQRERRAGVVPAWREAPIRVASAAAADLEARYRYPKRIQGKYVTLIVPPDADPSPALLTSMDEHLEQQSARLGLRLQRPIYWVRGELLGSRDTHWLGWVVGDASLTLDQPVTSEEKRLASLAYLNLVLSPDAAPPNVLREGWSRLGGYTAVQLRQELLERWQEIDLEQTWRRLPTSASTRSVVNLMAGPVVEYLLEMRGSEGLVAMLTQSTEANFETTFAEIYGMEWSECERNFMEWLEHHHPEHSVFGNDGANASGELDEGVEVVESIGLGAGVDGELWERVLGAMRDSHLQRSSIRVGAWKSVKEMQIESQGSALVPAFRNQEVVKMVLNDHEAWYYENLKGDSLSIVASGELQLVAKRSTGEDVRLGEVVRGKSEREELRQSIVDACRMIHLIGDPWLVLRKGADQGAMVTSLEEDGSLLRMTLQLETPKGDGVDEMQMVIQTRKGYLLERLVEKVGSKPHSERLYDIASEEDLHHIKRVAAFDWQDGERKARWEQRVDRLDTNQRRSFQDELRSIKIDDRDMTDQMPAWMVRTRWSMLAWSVISFLLTSVYALLRF